MATNRPTTDSQPSSPLIASDHANDNKYHLLLAASGSVATIKLPNIVQGLSEATNLSIRIIVTSSAAKFLQGQSPEQPSLHEIAKFTNVDAIHYDEDEWKTLWTRGAPILHIELRRWADILVIAPLSANTLAKITNGICDNLLTSVVRAWQVEDNALNSSQRRIIVAPAMNTAMWRHPLTKQQLSLFCDDNKPGPWHWIQVLMPVEKTLACGDTGDGAMRPWNEIVHVVKQYMQSQGIVRHKAS